MLILVIDDDCSVAEAIRMLLESEGVNAILANSGADGVLAFEKTAFDAVLVDIFMPEMDGLETIKHLRRQSRTVPIIAMSGFRFRQSTGAPDLLQAAVKLGATAYLPKPFGPQQLMAAIIPHGEPVETRENLAIS